METRRAMQQLFKHMCKNRQYTNTKQQWLRLIITWHSDVQTACANIQVALKMFNQPDLIFKSKTWCIPAIRLGQECKTWLGTWKFVLLHLKKHSITMTKWSNTLNTQHMTKSYFILQSLLHLHMLTQGCMHPSYIRTHPSCSWMKYD